MTSVMFSDIVSVGGGDLKYYINTVVVMPHVMRNVLNKQHSRKQQVNAVTD